MSHDLSDVLAANVARLRGERGWSQEDLARHARAIGMRWTRSSVARLETSRTTCSLGDALVLANLLEVPLTELLAAEAPGIVWVSGVPFPARTLRYLPAGDRLSLLGADELLRMGDIVIDDDPRWVERAREYGLRADEASAALFAVDETDRRAARRLRGFGVEVEPQEVALAARHLWGTSLGKRRDLLIRPTDAGSSTSMANQRSGLRAHVTRDLIDELRTHFEARRT